MISQVYYYPINLEKANPGDIVIVEYPYSSSVELYAKAAAMSAPGVQVIFVPDIKAVRIERQK